jgi:catechol 2,3-dioxygenase-like lactoylglutathione lyase family enzyme
MSMRLHHVSIPVAPHQLAEGRAFYSEAFGLREIEPPATLGPNRVVWFDLDGRELHLFVEEGANQVPSDRHLAFEVDDLDGFRARLAEHGIAAEEAVPIHNRPRLFIHDPFGNRVEVTQIIGPYQ